MRYDTLGVNFDVKIFLYTYVYEVNHQDYIIIKIGNKRLYNKKPYYIVNNNILNQVYNYYYTF